MGVWLAPLAAEGHLPVATTARCAGAVAASLTDTGHRQGRHQWLCVASVDCSERCCPVRLQICLFCWHKINETGNKQCPACRQEYDTSVVHLTTVDPEQCVA